MIPEFSLAISPVNWRGFLRNDSYVVIQNLHEPAADGETGSRPVPVALESLADAEALSGNGVLALAIYRRAAAVEPHSATAKEMIRHLSAAVPEH